jgi:hypothetical protein
VPAPSARDILQYRVEFSTTELGALINLGISVPSEYSSSPASFSTAGYCPVTPTPTVNVQATLRTWIPGVILECVLPDVVKAYNSRKGRLVSLRAQHLYYISSPFFW